MGEKDRAVEKVEVGIKRIPIICIDGCLNIECKTGNRRIYECSVQEG